MRLPYVKSIAKEKKEIGAFAGLDKRLVTQENAFFDMKNISGDLYPVLSERPGRGQVIKNLTNPNGLLYKNGLMYVDGTELFYNDEKLCDVEDSKKQMVGMGAYVIIMPDKIVINTKTKEATPIERAFTQSSQATIEPTYEGSVYVKITCTGIGTNFNQWDGIELSGCTNEAFNKSCTIQAKTEDSITILADLLESFTQAEGLTVKRKAPDMDFITECDNRIWGCSSANHEVYASKLGDPWNFNAFEGISTDSYAATIGSDGDFTGIGTYAGYVLFFKEHKIHKVYGNKPSNIQIMEMDAEGVKKGCEHSVKVAGDTLLYTSCTGVCGYTGGQPFKLGEQLKGINLENTVAGIKNGKYYLSSEELYCLQDRLWYKEDEERFLFATEGDGNLYYIDQNGNLKTIDGGEERITWSLESTEQEDGTTNNKALSQLQIVMELERGSWADVYIRYDHKEYKKLMTVSAADKKYYRLPLKLERCRSYRWKLEGAGKMKLFAVVKYIEKGSEV